MLNMHNIIAEKSKLKKLLLELRFRQNVSDQKEEYIKKIKEKRELKKKIAKLSVEMHKAKSQVKKL